MRIDRIVPAVASLLATLACGGSQPPPGTTSNEPTGAKGASAPTAAGPDAIDWEKMSHNERMEHMKQVVLPTMKPEFQRFGPSRYADFACTTCHGPGAQRGEFDMPSDALPKLPPNGDFAKLPADQGPAVEFMLKTVVPKMADALGMTPFDPATGQGFGCYACHQTE